MSLLLQFNHLIQNESARKAMYSYIGFLEKAFEQYRDLWEDYIKLQEKHEQCNVSSPSQMTTAEPCVKNELTVEKQLNSNIIIQESDDNSLLQLDSLQIDTQDFFDDDIDTDFANLNEDFLDNSPSKSPVFFKKYPKTSNVAAKMFVRSPKRALVCNKSTANSKMFHNEKVSSEQKLEIDTTYHVETTFLPNGKKLKQSRLTFHPVKHDKKKISLINVDELKSVDTIQKVKQDLTDTLVIGKPITVEDNGIEVNETEDIIEISPTQRDIQCKSKYYSKLKRKFSEQTIKNSLDKNKHHSLESNFATKSIMNDTNFSLWPSSEFASVQVTYDQSLAKDSNIVNALKHNINIDNSSLTQKSSKTDVKGTKSIDNQEKSRTVRNKVQNISQDLNNLYEEETFYLPAEQTADENNTGDFTLNDTENKPSAKKLLLNKLHASSKKKENMSEQFNMRCKADRAKLNGQNCWECEKYYKNLSLSKEELQKRKNQCSRHRQKYERPTTPEGFWDPEFPETLSSTYRHDIK